MAVNTSQTLVPHSDAPMTPIPRQARPGAISPREPDLQFRSRHSGRRAGPTLGWATIRRRIIAGPGHSAAPRDDDPSGDTALAIASCVAGPTVPFRSRHGSGIAWHLGTPIVAIAPVHTLVAGHPCQTLAKVGESGAARSPRSPLFGAAVGSDDQRCFRRACKVRWTLARASGPYIWHDSL